MEKNTRLVRSFFHPQSTSFVVLCAGVVILLSPLLTFIGLLLTGQINKVEEIFSFLQFMLINITDLKRASIIFQLSEVRENFINSFVSFRSIIFRRYPGEDNFNYFLIFLQFSLCSLKFSGFSSVFLKFHRFLWIFVNFPYFLKFLIFPMFLNFSWFFLNFLDYSQFFSDFLKFPWFSQFSSDLPILFIFLNFPKIFPIFPNFPLISSFVPEFPKFCLNFLNFPRFFSIFPNFLDFLRFLINFS